MKKHLILFASVSAVILSCTKEPEVLPDLAATSSLVGDNNIFYASTTLSGANEVPAFVTTATGDASGTYDKTTKLLKLNVNYTGITPTAWHIHKAAVGANGGVVFNLGSTFSSPFAYTTPALTADQETDLLGGLNYLNIHSAKSPSGEIRGQLAVANTKAKGEVTGKFNPNTNILTVTITYADITPTMWHIHKGAAGVAGPVVFDLGTTFTSPFTFSTPALTAEQVADLKAGLYYVNIHSKRAPSGEIRGQITVK